MAKCKIYQALCIIALMALTWTLTEAQAGNTTNLSTTPTATTSSGSSSTVRSNHSSQTNKNNGISTRPTTSVISSTKPDDSLFSKYLETVSPMGIVAVSFALVVSHIVLACCICDLKRRASYWPTSRNVNRVKLTECEDASKQVDPAPGLSETTILMKDIKLDQDVGQPCDPENTAASEAEATNGDAQCSEQVSPKDVAEALLVV